MTLATPLDLLRSTGLKAVDHALERMTSNTANAYSDAVSELALQMLNEGLGRLDTAPDDLHVRSEMRDGGQTRAIDLQGRERAIDRIEMVYRAKPNFKGSAKICVSGLS
jgi:hypothetical protein